MRTQILRLLRSHEEISGEAISREFGVSRAAVAKHIKALREAGYRIEATPSRGYRFVQAPDLVSAEELACFLPPESPWQLHYYTELDSTNSQIRRLAEAGAPDHTAVLCEAQTAGQGRLERGWHSPAGEAIYLSYLLRPQLSPQLAQTITLLSACAVVATLARFGFQAQIKWPNDVLSADGRKLCGIKSEMRADMDQVSWLLCGIGLNINTADFPAPLAATATSLYRLGGQSQARAPIAAALLTEIDAHYSLLCREGFAPLRTLWLQQAVSIGKQVRVSNAQEEYHAIARDLDENGYLIVEKEGRLQTLTGGDIWLT